MTVRYLRVSYRQNGVRNEVQYRGADKSLARPWKETSYSDQTYNTIPRLMAYKQQQYIAVVCTP